MVYKIAGFEWVLAFPRITTHVDERFASACNLSRRGADFRAINELVPLVEEYPEFVEARYQLALALNALGKKEEAYAHLQVAVEYVTRALPEQFCIGRDRLIWGCGENQPFLRACIALGIEHRRRGLIGEALSVFRTVLDLNPTDSWAPGLIVECFFALRRPMDVLTFCERFDDFWDPDVIYGRVLALAQLGHEQEAAEEARFAIRSYPLVAKELVKRRHTEPRGSIPGSITEGGVDQAYAYWKSFGQHWDRITGAKTVLRRLLRKNSPAGLRA